MNKLSNGTEYRSTPAGLIVVRGKRELHLLGTSAAQSERARTLLSSVSFNRLFTAARKSPASRNVAFIKVAA
jgi:hypothetical protein